MFLNSDTLQKLQSNELSNIGTEVYRWDNNTELSFDIKCGILFNPGLDDNTPVNKTDCLPMIKGGTPYWAADLRTMTQKRKMFFNSRKRVYNNFEILDKIYGGINGDITSVDKNVISLSASAGEQIRMLNTQSYQVVNYELSQQSLHLALILNSYLRSYLSVIVPHTEGFIVSIDNVFLFGEYDSYSVSEEKKEPGKSVYDSYLLYNDLMYRRTNIMGFVHNGTSIEYSITPFVDKSRENSGVMVDVKMFTEEPDNCIMENLFFKYVPGTDLKAFTMKEMYEPLHTFVREIM